MSDTLRFGVGDPVRCKVSATQWKKGTVVALHYREDQWPEDMVAPYQVQLNNGPLIYAPQDDDRLIQADDGMELEVAVATGGRAEIHVCQAGPCRRAGGEAVLLEIEELAKSVGGRSAQPGERRAGRTGVTVQPSGWPAQTLDSTLVRWLAGSAPAGSAMPSVDDFVTTTSASPPPPPPVALRRAALTSATDLPAVAAAGSETPISAAG